MKIAYIVTRAHPIGGVQVHVRDLALELLKLGHEPVVVTSGNGVYTEGLREAGVETISLSSLGRDISPIQDVRAFRDLQGVLKRLQPDLVSTHSAKAGILGGNALTLLEP